MKYFHFTLYGLKSYGNSGRPKFFWWVGFLVAFYTVAPASRLSPPVPRQNSRGGISGYVLDGESKEPLIGANVVVIGTGIGAATNKFGYFAIPDLQENTYEVRASFIGYREQVRKITIGSAQFVSITFDLTPEPLSLNSVEISADFYREEEKKLSTFSVPMVRLKDIPAIGESDLLRSLQLLPGVQAANELSSGLYIRGGSPDQNLILLDGITVYNPNHLFGFFSTFNNDAIKDVKLIKGGYPAEYGGRLSAVLDITDKDGNRKKFSSNGAVSLISSKLLVEGPIRGGSYMISGRRTYFDLVVPLAGVQDIPNYYFYDFNAKLNLDGFERDKFHLSTYFGRDILDYQQKENGVLTNQIKIGWGNRVVSGNWVHLFNPNLFSTLLVAWSDFNSLVNADASGFSVRFQNQIQDLSLKADLQWFGWPARVEKFGVWLTRYKFLTSIEIGENTGFENTIVNRPVYSALYFQDEWHPTPLWLLTSGLRLNFFSSGNRVHIEPRLQIRRQLSDRFALIASVGTYTQFTTVVVNDLASFADLWYPVDETIDALRSQHYILGIDYTLSHDLELKVEAYYKPMQNILEFKPRQDTNREKLNEIFYQGSGLARGVELFVQKNSGRIHGWLGYTWSKTDRTFVQVNHGKSFPAKWDFTHDLTATLAYQFTRKWNLGTTFVYRSGQTYTVPTGQYRLGPPLFPLDYIRAGAKNSARLEPYHRLDVSATYRFQKFGGHWTFTLNLYNIYNHRNVWFRNYNFEDPSQPPEITDIRLLPILPTVELSFTF